MPAASRTRIGCLLFIGLLISGCASAPPKVVAAKDRALGAGEAIVLVPQSEIQPEVKASNGGAAFGLVGAIVDISVTQHRANLAESSIVPLRDALAGYTFDQKVLAESRQSFAKVDWLHVSSTEFAKDASPSNVSVLMDKTPSPQILVATYAYTLSPDFATMKVSARYTLLPRAVPKGEQPSARVKLKYALYSRSMSYQVSLPAPSKDLAENCKAWSADGAARARKALDLGIVRLATLFERNMLMTTDDIVSSNSGVLEDDGAGKLSADRTGNWSYVANAGAE